MYFVYRREIHNGFARRIEWTRVIDIVLCFGIHGGCERKGTLS